MELLQVAVRIARDLFSLVHRFGAGGERAAAFAFARVGRANERPSDPMPGPCDATTNEGVADQLAKTDLRLMLLGDGDGYGYGRGRGSGWPASQQQQQRKRNSGRQ